MPTYNECILSFRCDAQWSPYAHVCRWLDSLGWTSALQANLHSSTCTKRVKLHAYKQYQNVTKQHVPGKLVAFDSACDHLGSMMRRSIVWQVFGGPSTVQRGRLATRLACKGSLCKLTGPQRICLQTDRAAKDLFANWTGRNRSVCKLAGPKQICCELAGPATRVFQPRSRSVLDPKSTPGVPPTIGRQ
jgi:hypothetical protein